MNVILYGVKCSGKSTLGQQLSQDYGYHFIDTDQLLLKNSPHHSSVTDIFHDLGRQAFKEYEETLIEKLRCEEPTVIACGGSTMLSMANQQHLKSLGMLIYLTIDLETMKKRISQLSTLPAFIRKEQFERDCKDYFDQRSSLYSTLTYLHINSTRDLSSTLHSIEESIHGLK